MKHHLAIVFVLLSLKLYCQEFKVYDEVEFPELNKKYQIGREFPEGYEIFTYNHTGTLYKVKKGMDKNDKTKISPSYLILRILDLNSNVIKESVIKDNDIDTEFASFNKQYIGKRKFIIIKSRFDFYLLNLSTDILVTPDFSIKRDNVELSDIQGLNLRAIEIFDNGQYIIFNKSDFGTYCLKLQDFYNPKLVEAYYSGSPALSEYYVFLDHRVDDIYNAIKVKRSYREIENITYLFKGYRFQQDENDSIITKEVDDQFLKLLQKGEDDEKILDLIIDYKNGILVN